MLLLPVKQNLFNRYGGGVVHMGCEILVPVISLPLPPTLEIFSRYGLGVQIAAVNALSPTSQQWGTANRALFFPVTIPSKFIVRTLIWTPGTTGAGNYDFGIYDAQGSLLRSLGSTPHPGTVSPELKPISALSLQPGTYWVAFAMDTITDTILGASNALAFTTSTMGLKGTNATFPLPVSTTFGNSVGALLPALSISDF